MMLLAQRDHPNLAPLTLHLNRAQASVGMNGRVSLELAGPKVVGVIGANGSGKSSLLRLMSGLNSLNQEGVYLSEDALFDLTPLERSRRISYLPQSPPISSAWSVEEILRQGLYPYRGSDLLLAQERRLEELVINLDLSHLRSRSVVALSGGELRRVLIARTLTQGTQIILLDEPLANLDWPSQEYLMAQLRGKGSHNHLLIIALHCLNLAALYTDELVIVSQGKIIGHDKSEIILNSPLIQEAFQAEPLSVVHPEHFTFQHLPQGPH